MVIEYEVLAYWCSICVSLSAFPLPVYTPSRFSQGRERCLGVAIRSQFLRTWGWCPELIKPRVWAYTMTIKRVRQVLAAYHCCVGYIYIFFPCYFIFFKAHILRKKGILSVKFQLLLWPQVQCSLQWHLPLQFCGVLVLELRHVC